MAADRDKGSPGKAGSRRMRRAAVALGAATTLFCGVGVPNAGAAVTTGADVEAIKQLKHRYFASVDMDNWPQLYHDLAPDVVVDTTGALGAASLFCATDVLVEPDKEKAAAESGASGSDAADTTRLPTGDEQKLLREVIDPKSLRDKEVRS